MEKLQNLPGITMIISHKLKQTLPNFKSQLHADHSITKM
jgi:hypothetical protein